MDDPGERQSFGALLRSHRTTTGLTQEELAERAGLSRRGIADLERGVRRAPYSDTVDRLAAALELSESARRELARSSRPVRRASPPPPCVVNPVATTRPRQDQPELGASFGDRLRHLRVRAGLSQAALAKRAGLAAAAVAALERGVRRSPYPQTLGALADALNLTADERAAFADAATAARRVQPTPRPVPSATQPELRLMLVDDEDLYRDLLQTALAQQPRLRIVGTFSDAETALSSGPSLQPDVAVLDIQLGRGQDGIHLGLALRQRLPKLGIVLLSNHADLRFAAAMHQWSVTGWSYLLKQSVRDVGALRRAVEGAADGDVVLDSRLVDGLQPRAGGPLDPLTPRQREILGLVAQGMTNPAIAQQLLLDEKSVENQLTDTYAALGIERREDTVHARVKAVLVYLQASRFVSSGAAVPRGSSSGSVSGREASTAVP